MSSTLKGGRYELHGVLGSGAQGETLDALDTTNQKRVAIKKFQVRGAKSWKDVELAEREARVLAAIEHPRLPRYIDHFEEDGALFLVMDCVEGESLARFRKRGVTLSREELVRLLAELGEVLDYLHGRMPPIIHRDIKPGNVIRQPDGSFSLVDFGSVRDSLKPEGGSTVVGTFGYMAPEQFQGRALPQSDVYALGATALGLVTGREPEDLPHRGLAIDVAAALPNDPAVARVLGKMLDPDPDRRATRVAPLLGELFAAPGNAPGAASGNAPAYKTVPEYGSGPVWEPGKRSTPLVPNALIVVVLVLGLIVARFSTGLLFRVFLPILLTLLSLFFGGGLRRAARRMRNVGERGDQGLKHAIEVVRGRAPSRSGTRGQGPRQRVEPADDPGEDAFEPGSARGRSRRERRG